jgi:alpha-glucosidase (family GH31 glycosyl hydrolase)
MWNDIDYMDKYYDWTTDPVRYPSDQMAAFIDHLHSIGKHFIPIVDAGVAKDDYFGYNDGIDMNVFIPSPNVEGEPFTGKVWPGLAVFVDWWHPNATTYWEN